MSASDVTLNRLGSSCFYDALSGLLEYYNLNFLIHIYLCPAFVYKDINNFVSYKFIDNYKKCINEKDDISIIPNLAPYNEFRCYYNIFIDSLVGQSTLNELIKIGIIRKSELNSKKNTPFCVLVDLLKLTDEVRYDGKKLLLNKVTYQTQHWLNVYDESDTIYYIKDKYYSFECNIEKEKVIDALIEKEQNFISLKTSEINCNYSRHNIFNNSMQFLLNKNIFINGSKFYLGTKAVQKFYNDFSDIAINLFEQFYNHAPLFLSYPTMPLRTQKRTYCYYLKQLILSESDKHKQLKIETLLEKAIRVSDAWKVFDYHLDKIYLKKLVLTNEVGLLKEKIQLIIDEECFFLDLVAGIVE